jgi:hypothetical protein
LYIEAAIARIGSEGHCKVSTFATAAAPRWSASKMRLSVSIEPERVCAK